MAASRFFLNNLREVLLDIRYCEQMDYLSPRVQYALGMIHGARFNDLLRADEHHNLYLLLQDARQRAYGHFADVAHASHMLKKQLEWHQRCQPTFSVRRSI